MSIRMHKRHSLVSEARSDIYKAVSIAVKKYELTYGELTFILAKELSSWADWQITDERDGSQPAEPKE